MRAAGTAPTRRQLLGGLALGLAGPAGAAWAKSAPVQSGGDAEVLRRMLEVEQFAVFAYRRALASGTLSMRAKPVVGLILGHEQEHVRMLVRALAARGGGFPVLPDCARAGSRPGTVNPCELHSQKESLSLLLDVEEACEAVYYHGLSKLRDPGLARTGSQIMAAEAQHAAALSGLLHPGQISRAVPDAFVEGKT